MDPNDGPKETNKKLDPKKMVPNNMSEAGGASEDRNGGGGSPRSMVPPNLVGSSEDPRLHEEAQRRGSCPQRN